MAETKSSFLDRMGRALEEVAPRLQADADLEAKHRVARERLQAARRAGSLVSEDDLRTVRLAVERVRAQAAARAA